MASMDSKLSPMYEHWVVPDWNWLLGLPKDAESLPRGYEYIIPDVVFAEVIGSLGDGSDSNHGRAGKLYRILRENRDRVWIGRFWNELSQLEVSPDAPVIRDQIIHREFTTRMRGLLGRDEDEWRSELSGMSDDPAFHQHERFRAQFKRLCNKWSDWIGDKQSVELRQMANDEDAQHKWIRNPVQPVELIVRENERLDTQEFREALERFPDMLAAGRWGRIIVWYALQRALNPQGNHHKFENDWDDAHYVFLASYANRIVTLDKPVKRAIRALQPSTQILSELD